ncbi:Ig-like domain-containing protein [Tuwongella immobilis]|uniref:SbsA Ig-like domain-containing protein n=1 Tax=Tuwongella immobilis TaxID=692036 RepID=A0A6C2YQW7_9BACT|nr:Ig-like domain-containing protein [Tuwongella immobilis]VIP03385.1 sigma-70 family rna polymerase sigma factor : RNA polymerase sigma factor, sigma-70 family OS=Singulisphaera acidiphila (strain ATCC BAA-1392 / DSM 18658 / VKM B-2454 / MOB10) GN=Sinac_4894 PE=4 SV=1: Big_5 [Tuwongella immobilis]VTS04142.1 sigma-70 family rna polymerase sigma factor : RNA polymerase sigma factor, sigma-70 family OS=Singulisphaera acidiphila (strain ATCC BAA-1392 / DSM 18658 / VKM B-2454 / MOB10) GN=Sinac_4894 P
MIRKMIMVLGMCGTLFVGHAKADEYSLQSAPPVVVKTMPESGTQGVPVTTREIRVVFSKPMKLGTWSWGMVSKESFPTLNGKPKFLDDGKTCILPVKLDAGKTYSILVNTPKLTGFQDEAGTPAMPYLIIFETAK